MLHEAADVAPAGPLEGHGVHDAPHEVHSEAARPPLARVSPQVDLRHVAGVDRPSVVDDLDAQIVAGVVVSHLDGAVARAAVGVLDHVRGRLVDRECKLLRLGAVEAGFPKVDAETQKGRDDMRRKVLADELATEEKLLADARTLYANGAPVPLPEEQGNAAKYQERIARLRQSVQLHERNIEALRKELGATR